MFGSFSMFCGYDSHCGDTCDEHEAGPDPTRPVSESSHLDEQRDVGLAALRRRRAALILDHMLQSFQAVVDRLCLLGVGGGVAVGHQHPVLGIILLRDPVIDRLWGGGCWGARGARWAPGLVVRRAVYLLHRQRHFLPRSCLAPNFILVAGWGRRGAAAAPVLVPDVHVDGRAGLWLRAGVDLHLAEQLPPRLTCVLVPGLSVGAASSIEAHLIHIFPFCWDVVHIVPGVLSRLKRSCSVARSGCLWLTERPGKFQR